MELAAGERFGQMPARKTRSGAVNGTRKRNADRGSAQSYFGWTDDADPERDIFVRSVLFSVLVVAIVSVGGWFLIGGIGDTSTPRPALSADGVATNRPVYTLMLFEISPNASATERQNLVSGLSEEARLRPLVGRHAIECVDLGGGKRALCVGRFDSENDPELQDLRDKFRGFTERGERPFESASIRSYGE